MKLFKHLRTVGKHRRQVRKNCFKVGLYKQGLLHDLSKYSPAEFIPGVRYWQGNRSPQAREREVNGFSAAWLHHKSRNKHHFEYWVDSGVGGSPVAVAMPIKYLAEMICDRIAASKVYNGENYTNSSPLEYYQKRKDNSFMHADTARELEYFLQLLSDKGESVMFAELKKYVKESKKRKRL